MKMPEKKDFSSQLLPQLASDYPPPIWSLSSPHLIIGYRWICRISFHIFHHICSKWQCSEPHIMYYTIFGSGFSTYLPLGVDQANLVIYTLNFVLVLLGNATCTGMMYTTADWSSRFLRNITAFASEFPHYWSAILKIRGGVLQIREWTTARGWSWSTCTPKESRDQGCLCSAFNRAPCIAPRNSWFPGTAGNLLTGIQLY